MKQYEAVAEVIRRHGGYATLAQIYQDIIKLEGCHWGTKTPFASVRRIVQTKSDLFFKIKPGLWGLVDYRDKIPPEVLSEEPEPISAKDNELLNHSYYQGIAAETGNFQGYHTFVPHQDRNKIFIDRKLGEIITKPEIPQFTYPELVQKAKGADVIWFNKRGFPERFIEIEYSTDMNNALLRFLEFQDFQTKFIIAADAARHREFQSKIENSAFQPILNRIEFWDYEKLCKCHEKASAAAELEKILRV